MFCLKLYQEAACYLGKMRSPISMLPARGIGVANIHTSITLLLPFSYAAMSLSCLESPFNCLTTKALLNERH